MNIVFQCNLDDVSRDVAQLNANKASGTPVPRKGESVRISFIRNGQRYSYDLAVVNVSYDYGAGSVIVELHMPAVYSTWSITRWSEWFKSHRYG
jgi:hypothetical protein